LSLVVEAGDSVRDGAGESVGVSEGAVGELIRGAYFGSHSTVSQGRAASGYAAIFQNTCYAPFSRIGLNATKLTCS
jgi:hypothetical protein